MSAQNLLALPIGLSNWSHIRAQQRLVIDKSAKLGTLVCGCY